MTNSCVYLSIRMCMCTCECVCMRTCMNVCVHVCMCVCMYVCVCVCVCVRVCVGGWVWVGVCDRVDVTNLQHSPVSVKGTVREREVSEYHSRYVLLSLT